MCGICLRCRPLASGSNDAAGEDRDWEALVANVRLRGPDQSCTTALSWPGYDVQLVTSVLGLRGSAIVAQPLRSPLGLLAWNGQIFARDHRPCPAPLNTALGHLFAALAQGANDGQALLDAVEELVQSTSVTSESALCSLLNHIDGPYAFCFVSASASTAVYGRDPLGRRSLLHARQGDELILASCGAGTSHAFTEVPCDSYFLLRTSEEGADSTIIPRSRPQCNLPAPAPGPCLLPPAPGPEVVSELIHVLQDAVASRTPQIHCRATDSNVSTALLFSGGVDCTLLAVLAHLHLPPHETIDLLNVAFASAQGYDSPDRQTARLALGELQALHPARTWRLVEINVSREEYAAERQNVLSLMAPSNTVMDLSIASALYFAARGRGEGYRSPARVLLSGLGADELFGGYQRHRLAYERRGYAGLREELQLDLDRLPERNLGRDDRVISATGKEARFPFLALSVVQLVAQLPVERKAFYPSNGDRIGDKRLLRDAARAVGLRDTAERAKRAIQFGSRSAKLDAPAGGKHARGVRTVQ